MWVATRYFSTSALGSILSTREGLQAYKRSADPEVSREKHPSHGAPTERELTERLFNDYFLPAGVSEKWLDRLRGLIKNQDYFQTGEDLVKEESHIITHPLDNVVPGDEVEGRKIIGDF